MKQIIKRFAVTLGFTLMGMFFGWLARDLKRPDYPEHWNNLRLGMSTLEAQTAVPQLAFWKEADRVTIDFGDREWSLCVIYDTTGHVVSIYKTFIDRRFGMMKKHSNTGFVTS